MLVNIGGIAESLPNRQRIEEIGKLRAAPESKPASVIDACREALTMQWAETDTDRARLSFWLAKAMLAKAVNQSAGAFVSQRDIHMYAQRAAELAYKAD